MNNLAELRSIKGPFDSPPSAAPHWFPIEVNSKSNAKEEDDHQCGQNEVPKTQYYKLLNLRHLKRENIFGNFIGFKPFSA